MLRSSFTGSAGVPPASGESEPRLCLLAEVESLRPAIPPLGAPAARRHLNTKIIDTSRARFPRRPAETSTSRLVMKTRTVYHEPRVQIWYRKPRAWELIGADCWKVRCM